MNNLPIGFYDSGLGGISVLKQAYRLLPKESYIYYGDAKNAPYGSKTEDEILNLSLRCGEFLHKKNVKMIVIACNTATSIAVNIMREKYNIPIVSIEPAIKPAITASKEGRVLVMATPATINQSRYNNLLAKYDPNNRVINMECEGLSLLIEKGDFAGKEITDYLQNKFSKVSQTIDGIVIGCTHYSFISDAISKVAKTTLRGKCEIFDGMYGVAKRIYAILEQENLFCQNQNPNMEFYSSDNNFSALNYKHFFDFL